MQNARNQQLNSNDYSPKRGYINGETTAQTKVLICHAHGLSTLMPCTLRLGGNSAKMCMHANLIKILHTVFQLIWAIFLSLLKELLYYHMTSDHWNGNLYQLLGWVLFISFLRQKSTTCTKRKVCTLSCSSVILQRTKLQIRKYKFIFLTKVIRFMYHCV